MDNNSQQQLQQKETSTKVVKKDDVDPTAAPTELLQLYEDDRIKKDYYIKYDKYQRTRGYQNTVSTYFFDTTQLQRLSVTTTVPYVLQP
mmetsp:Transcript_63642/g.71235  ORF Transcript_63642/g.71235 Transcript_63642/m.71235 type:complete len:89 (+) Transcript_63642:165-431(+)